MKNTITTFALVVAAFVAVNLIMSFAKPVAAPDEPKQYIVIRVELSNEKFQQAVTQKLTEGWHPQGGVHVTSSTFYQAMVK